MSDSAIVDGSTLVRLQQRLREQLGPRIGVACTDVDGDPDSLYPEERAHLARAIPRRQREYAAGRQAARRAMAAIGWPAAAVPSAPDRSPVWPSGLAGSIAHTRGACVAVVARSEDVAAIGIDLEDDRPLAADLWPTVCTPAERAFLHAQPREQRGTLATRLFSAKEAVYKCQFPLTRRMLDFQDVHVVLDPEGIPSRFDASISAPEARRHLRGWLLAGSGPLAALCWLPAASRAAEAARVPPTMDRAGAL